MNRDALTFAGIVRCEIRVDAKDQQLGRPSALNFVDGRKIAKTR